MTGTIITLELSPRLQEEQIVTRYIFDLKTNGLVIELSHKYDKQLSSKYECKVSPEKSQYLQ